MTPARWVAVAAVLVAILFAWRGGSFSTAEYLQLKRDEVAARVRLALLLHEVDSLRGLRDSLDRNPAFQEWYAREHFGMLRPGELSITIVPDTLAH